MTHEKDDRHRRESWVAAGLTVMLPVVVVALVTNIRQVIGIADPNVLAWSPENGSPWSYGALIVAIPVALILLFKVRSREKGSWFGLVRWPWLALGLVTGLATVPSLRADMRVYSDRVVVTRYDGTQTIFPMATAQRVEVRCDGSTRQRISHVYRVRYQIRFEGVTVYLASRNGTAGFDNIPLDRLAELDRANMTAVPHEIEVAPRCAAGLRRTLDPADFAHVAHLLGLGAQQPLHHAGAHHAS